MSLVTLNKQKKTIDPIENKSSYDKAKKNLIHGLDNAIQLNN